MCLQILGGGGVLTCCAKRESWSAPVVGEVRMLGYSCGTCCEASLNSLSTS